MPVISNPKGKGSGNLRQLDYEKAFRYWLELGTLDKATEAMERDGYLIRKKDGTTRPFTKGAIHRGAWVWVIEHPDEALKIWQAQGLFLNGKDEEWKRWMWKRIQRYSATDLAIREWIKINDMVEWYEENILKSA